MSKPRKHKTAVLMSESGRILQRWPKKPTSYELLAALLEQQYETNRLLRSIDASIEPAIDYRDAIREIVACISSSRQRARHRSPQTNAG